MTDVCRFCDDKFIKKKRKRRFCKSCTPEKRNKIDNLINKKALTKTALYKMRRQILKINSDKYKIKSTTLCFG